MNDADRVKLVYEVLSLCIDRTETICSDAGDLGGQMAYLMGAICNPNPGAGIDLDEGDDVLDFFRAAFPADCKAWEFINTNGPVDELDEE